jgi:hypothetical protein
MVALTSCATVRSKPQDIESVVAKVTARTGKPSLAVGSVSSDLHMFRMVTAKGASRDLGRALGMIGIEIGYPFPAVPAQQRHNNASIIALYREIYPAYVERVAGIAEAYGRSVEDLDLAFTEALYVSRMGAEGASGILNESEETPFPECSVVAAQSPGGRTVVGRNLDTRNRTAFLVRSEVEGSFKSTGKTSTRSTGSASEGGRARHAILLQERIGRHECV